MITSELVALSALTFTSPLKSSAVPPPVDRGRRRRAGTPWSRRRAEGTPVRPTSRSAGSRCARVCRVVGEVLGVGVLEEDDVDAPSPAVGMSSLPHQLHDPLEAVGSGDDDQLVGALVGHHLADGALVPVGPARGVQRLAPLRGGHAADDRPAGGLPRRPWRLDEDLVHLVGHVAGRGVLDLDDADQVVRARPVEGLEQLLDAPDVEPDVGDEEDVRGEGLDVAVPETRCPTTAGSWSAST